MSRKKSSNFLTLSRLSGTGLGNNIASFKLSSGMYSSKYLFEQLATHLGNFPLNFSFSLIISNLSLCDSLSVLESLAVEEDDNIS